MRRRRHRRGFTLVELVVTIGIIILLAALTLSVSVAVVEGSEVRQTETTIRLLDTALKEWELSTDRDVTWFDPDATNPERYDMRWDTTHVFRITELLNTIGRSSGVKPILARIDPDFIHTYRMTEYPVWIGSDDESEMDSMWAVDAGTGSSGLTVVDAWDQPFIVIHPGRLFVTGETAVLDEDGTVNIDNSLVGPDHAMEQVYGTARNRQILFVSAGPDGKFGDLSADPDAGEAERELLQQTKDNLYSYEPIKETPP